MTLYILISFLLYSTISTTIKINRSLEESSAHWVVDVEIEWFLSIFNDCFCSTVIEDGEKSLYLLCNSLYSLRFFVQIMNDSIGTGRIIYCLNKETSMPKSTFKSLLGGDFFWPNTETLLVEIQKYSVKVFSAIHVRIATWIDYHIGGWNLLYFQQEQSFSVRACGCSLF